MTREDSVRLARGMAELGMVSSGSVVAVALALRKAFNRGVEAVAVDIETKFHVKIRGHKIGLYGVAEAVRAKKLPEDV